MSSYDSVRLNKFISDSGYCSRREADKLIASNQVKVNGRRPELGTRIDPGDVVEVCGQVIQGRFEDKSDRVYIAYNKPVGITCTTEQTVKGNIVDAIDHDHRIFPIGRMDKPSEGLILLTSDGDIVNKILRAENAHEKEYLVSVNKPLAPGFVEKMSRGVPILDTVTRPCKVRAVGKSAFRITLTQGLNRQIRRMCEYLGYEVRQLVRLRIMNVELGRLKPGQWRNLTRQEMEQIHAAIANSRSESGGGAAQPARNRMQTGKKARAGGPQANTARKPAGKSRQSAGHAGRNSDKKNEGRGSKRGEGRRPGRPASKKSPPGGKRRK